MRLHQDKKTYMIYATATLVIMVLLFCVYGITVFAASPTEDTQTMTAETIATVTETESTEDSQGYGTITAMIGGNYKSEDKSRWLGECTVYNDSDYPVQMAVITMQVPPDSQGWNMRWEGELDITESDTDINCTMSMSGDYKTTYATITDMAPRSSCVLTGTIENTYDDEVIPELGITRDIRCTLTLQAYDGSQNKSSTNTYTLDYKPDKKPVIATVSDSLIAPEYDVNRIEDGTISYDIDTEQIVSGTNDDGSVIQVPVVKEMITGTKYVVDYRKMYIKLAIYAAILLAVIIAIIVGLRHWYDRRLKFRRPEE